MEEIITNVVITPKARKEIVNIGKFIYLSGNPDNSINYMKKLYKFAYSLNLFPEKF